MDTPAAPSGFEAFGLSAPLLTALKTLGYEEPTPIQERTIPALLGGRDVLGQAATGTGKTAAFALPILSRLDVGAAKAFEAQALVLVPTRELAMQVAEAFTRYGQQLGVRVLAVYGGQEFHLQLKPLKRGVDVVVATPGRALDHLRKQTLKLDGVRFVVLDEADEMLDMGFAEDLDAILSGLPDTRQTALFSATLPPRIAAIAEHHLKHPVRVTIAPRSVQAGTLPNIRQAAYVVPRHLKEAALVRVLEAERPQSAIVFCRTRVEVDELTDALARHGYGTAALHGGMTQEIRDAVLRRFKAGTLQVLVATDVAARGLHVENLSHVVNYDLPTSPEPYVHRIGRTGRAGKEGVALSFLEPRELRLLKNIERVTKRPVPIAQVPTRAELLSRRADALAGLVEEALEAKVHAPLAALAGRLGEAHPIADVAAAALALLQDELFPPHPTDGVDFPRFEDRPARGPRGKERLGASSRDFGGRRDFDERGPRRERDSDERGPLRASDTGERGGRRDFDAGERGPRRARDADARGPRTEFAFDGGERPDRRGEDGAARDADAHPSKRQARFTHAGEARGDGARRPRRLGGAATWLFISLGERAGIRPKDLVGAISNEAGIAARNIGEILVSDESSRVEVPAADAPHIIEALRKTKLRGRKFHVDLHRGTGVAPTPARTAAPPGQRGTKRNPST
ncbi:MAG: DEAD/DEAH box helicase [Myxococcota bacterium]